MNHATQINFVSAGANNQNKNTELESAGNDTEVRYNQKQNLADTTFGEWEKHTKGIGAKLLLSMGFQLGRGLGKNLHGRTGIVEVNMRKGKYGVGASIHEGQEKQKSEMKCHADADEYKHKNISKVGEKDFPHAALKKGKVECQQCGKTFGSLDSLSAHEKAKNHNRAYADENKYKKISKARREKVARNRFLCEQVSWQETKKKTMAMVEPTWDRHFGKPFGSLTSFSAYERPKRHNLMKDKNSAPSEKKSAYGDLLKCNTCFVSFDTVKERAKHELKCNKSKRKCLSG